MRFAAIVALVALIEYMIILTLTGRARGMYDIKAPATTGHPIFERWYRVQMNTVEQLVVFLPALFLFASFVSPTWAGLIGLVWVAGRAVYAQAYVNDPERRGVGFALNIGANFVLVIGAFLGALLGG
ncbi:MAG: MAPEG family protein [Candidatus Binatia bacterium]